MTPLHYPLLAYMTSLYEQQNRKENIIIKKFDKGQLLFSQDEKAEKVMLIQEGITKCYFTEDNDKSYILEFLGVGEVIGEVELIRQMPCLCSIEAMTTVQVLAIAPAYFSELINTDLDLNHLLLDVFAQRITQTASRASFQQLYTVEHSLDKLLKLQSLQNITLSKEDMASYLGITVRSLNRAMKGK